MSAVRALPEVYRDAILMRYFQELPPGQIASALGIPVSTVKTRLQRALELLRNRLGPDHESDGGEWASAFVLLAWAPEVRAPAVAGFTATWIGAVVMGTQVKLAAVAVLVVSVGIMLYTWDGTDGSGSDVVDSNDQILPLTDPVTPEDPVVADVSPVTPPGTGADGDAVLIRGTVVDARTGRPLEDCRVEIGVGTRLRVRVEAATDDQGRYSVDVDREPFVEAGVVLSLRYRDYPVVREVKSVDYKQVEELNLGETRLSPGAAVSGSVVDPTGRPVPTATVRISRPQHFAQFGRMPAICTAVTGDDGGFTLPERIAPHSLHVLVAYAPSGVGWCQFPLPGNREVVDDLEIVIAHGVEALVQVASEPGQRVSGLRVTAIPGFQFEKGAGNPVVRLHRGDVRSALRSLPKPVARIFQRKTDEYGRADFSGLPARSDAPSRQQRYFFVVGNDVNDGLVHRVVLDLDSRNTLTLDYSPPAVCEVAGVVSADGVPTADVQITIGGRTTRSDSDGAYWLNDVPCSPIGTPVEVEATGFGGRYPREVKLRPGTRNVVPVKLLYPEHPASQVIGGRLVDQSGAPVESGRFRARQGDVEVLVQSGVDGYFRQGLPEEGEWSLYSRSVSVTPVRVITGDEDLEVVLERLPGRASLEATVHDAVTGLPVTPSAVLVRRLWPHPTAVDPSAHAVEGLIRVDDLSIGTWSLAVAAPDHPTREFQFEVSEPDKLVELPVVVGRAGRLHGEIITGDDPPATVRVRIRKHRPPFLESVARRPQSILWLHLGETTTFDLTPLPTGVPIVVTVHGSGKAAAAAVVLSEDQTEHVQFELQPAGTVRFSASELPTGRGPLEISALPHDDSRPHDTVVWAPFGSATPEKALDFEATLIPGRFRWRLALGVDRERERRYYEGTVEVRAGTASLVEITPRHRVTRRQ